MSIRNSRLAGLLLGVASCLVLGACVTTRSPLHGVTFIVPDSDGIAVTLDEVSPNPSNTYPMGRYQWPDSPARGSVVALDRYLVWEGDAGVVPIAVNRGGSGEFFYLAQLQRRGGDIVHVGSYPLGDRIAVERVAVSRGVATVEFRDHDVSQAMAESPAVERTINIAIADIED